jgi:hypothetical protein
MIDDNFNEEALIISTFTNQEGQVRRHATTFIRLECGPLKTPVVLYLDSNYQTAQCTQPMLITHTTTTDLVWAQFDKFDEIMLYALNAYHIIDPVKRDTMTKFIKEIVEGKEDS